MNWDEIIAVSGKPGLYKIVGQAKAGIFAEHLLTGKKILAPPVHISAMQDIVIFTNDDDVRLPAVMEKIRDAEKEGISLPDKKSSKDELIAFFEKIIPDYDKEKFYPSHMRKIMSWYEILKAAGMV